MNYNRPWYVVCSTDDAQLDGYKKRYGDRVIVFDKDKLKFDTMDNFGIKKVGSYARQACFPIARDLGYRYFLSLDDDYSDLVWRYATADIKSMPQKSCKHLEEMFEAMFEFLCVCPDLYELSFATCATYIGGVNAKHAWRDVIRRTVNTHFNDVEKWISYKGTFNDDINAYVEYSQRGKLFFMIPMASIIMEAFKKEDVDKAKGMQKERLELGIHNHCFYSVMLSPAAVRINTKDGIIFSTCCRVENYSAQILHEKWHKK